jgi:hypothetical protein
MDDEGNAADRAPGPRAAEQRIGQRPPAGVRLAGHGHPAIRATHHKTLELTRDPEISERATCVVAVGVDDEPAALAGDVAVTIRAGAQSFRLTARANSSWDPTGSAILRRSPLRTPATFATHASAAANDLPRAFVEALRDPQAVVEVHVEPVRGRACAVLFALDPDRRNDPRLRAELAAADLVVAEDEPAARLLGERVAHGPVEVAGRVLVLAVRELPGRTVAGALGAVDVETVGLPPSLSAAAASPSRAALLVAGPGTDPGALLKGAPADVRLVLAVDADEVVPTLRRAAELRGTHRAVLVQGGSPPVRVSADAPVELWSSEPVHLCLAPAPESTALDPGVRLAIDGLLADGVPTKAAARALAALTGWDRRRAYDAVLAWPKPAAGR